ncbi:MAG: lysophospholipid acyltransferase family protein [Candidatus Pacearchaeota archaeon]
MKNYFIVFNQMIIWSVMFIIFPFYKISIRQNRFKLDKSKKYLIVSNHVSKIDPFLITRFFPKSNKFKLLPYRYLTTDDYFKKWYIRWFLYFCGCFSTSKERNNGKKPLEIAQELINKRETIFIFPEGKLNPKGKMDKSIPIGVGAIYLEKNNPDLYLVPVKIEYPEKRKIRITYKKPFRHKSFPNNLKPLAEDLMDKIYE